MTFSTDAEARLQVVTAALNVGWPDNDPVLKELLRIRHEHAQLLGYADWAAFDAEVKMIGSGPAIARFNDELAADSQEAGERDLAVLPERARRDHPTDEWLHPATRRPHVQGVRRAQVDVEPQERPGHLEVRGVGQG